MDENKLEDVKQTWTEIVTNTCKYLEYIAGITRDSANLGKTQQEITESQMRMLDVNTAIGHICVNVYQVESLELITLLSVLLNVILKDMMSRTTEVKLSDYTRFVTALVDKSTVH